MPAGWEQAELWRQAAQLPGVQVLTDDEGGEALRFGVRTSGHVLLYDRNGRLCFSGGITAGRGQAGTSAGVEAVKDLVMNGASGQRQTPVFGCLLIEPRPQGAKEFEP
jgi:hypothetical protein